MKLRAIKIDRRFIPEWNDNKDLPPNEQLVINFSRIPATSEKSNYINYSFDTGGSGKLVYNDNLLCSAFISKIDNFELSDGTKIKDGKDLATTSHPRLASLFLEIRTYLFPEDEDLTQGESRA
jgi:hypothetical protein